MGPGGPAIPLLPKAKQAGQALRRAPHKILHKKKSSPPVLYTCPRRRGPRPPHPRGTFSCPFRAIHLVRTRGVSPPVSRNRGCIQWGQRPPLEKAQCDKSILSLSSSAPHASRYSAKQTRHIQPVARLARQVEHDPSALEHDGARAERQPAPMLCVTIMVVM